MAKDLAIAKRLKIGKAQQNMLGAVAITSFIVGASIVLGVYFLKYVRYDAAIIGAKDDAIKGYSDTIKNVGVCPTPRGKIYSDSELNGCDPNNTRANSVASTTLRAKVVSELARDNNLGSVGRSQLSVCMNNSTGEPYTYEQLYQKYELASEGEKEMQYEIFTMCSALRVIPDALPAAKNELALMASLNKIFNVSGFEPQSMAPGGDVDSVISGVGAIGVNLSIESSSPTVVAVIRNIERSIREFDIMSATIEWSSTNKVTLSAAGRAYYTEKAGLDEGLITVKGDGKVTKSLGGK